MDKMFHKFKALSKKELLINCILYGIGIIFMPLGVVLTINAHLGAGGYDALNFALGNKLGINTSLAIYSTAFLAIIIAALIRKTLPRFSTFISSFFLGVFTELWKAVFASVEGNSLLQSLVLFIVGMIVIAFAVAAYVISIFPSNPTDDLVVALTERKLRLGIAKISLDVVCVVIAIILGGEIGIGTIICTFGLGPVIDVFHQWILKILKKLNVTINHQT